MREQPIVIIEANGSKGVCTIRGNVTDWRSELFEEQANALLANGVADIDVYIDTFGGDAVSANRIINVLGKFTGTRTAIFGALVASAGTRIVLKCSVRKMPKNGVAMIHKPEMGVYGTYEQITAQQKLLKTITAEYASAYAEAFGLTIEEVAALWQNEYWMGADDALALGLATEIIDDVEITAERAVEIAAMAGPKITVQANAGTQPNRITPENKMSKLPLIAAMLQLPDTSDESAVMASVKALVKERDEQKTKIGELEQKLTAQAEAQVKALIDGAIGANKITEGERERYTKLAKLDFAEVQAMLADRAPHISASDRIAGGNGGQKDKYEGWDFERYQKEAPEVLAKMKAEDKPRFTQLFNEFAGRVNTNAKRG